MPLLLTMDIFWERKAHWSAGNWSGSPSSPSLTLSASLPSTLGLNRHSQGRISTGEHWESAPWARAVSGCYLVSTEQEKLAITIEQQFKRVCNQQETKSGRRKKMNGICERNWCVAFPPRDERLEACNQVPLSAQLRRASRNIEGPSFWNLKANGRWWWWWWCYRW